MTKKVGDKKEKTVKIEGFAPIIYADVTMSSLGYSGIKLTFSVVAPSDPASEDTQLIPQAMVCMSPEHARQVAELLKRNLETYENKYGKIREKPEPES